eukprot:850379_1
MAQLKGGNGNGNGGGDRNERKKGMDRLRNCLSAGGILVGPARWRCTECGGSKGDTLDCTGCSNAIQLAGVLNGKNDLFEEEVERRRKDLRSAVEETWRRDEEQVARMAWLRGKLDSLRRDLKVELDRRVITRRRREELERRLNELDRRLYNGRSALNCAFRSGLAGDTDAPAEMDGIIEGLEEFKLGNVGRSDLVEEENLKKECVARPPPLSDAEEEEDCEEKGNDGTGAQAPALSNQGGFSFGGGLNKGRRLFSGRRGNRGGGRGKAPPGFGWRRGSRACLDFNRSHCKFGMRCRWEHSCIYCGMQSGISRPHGCCECRDFAASGAILASDGKIHFHANRNGMGMVKGRKKKENRKLDGCGKEDLKRNRNEDNDDNDGGRRNDDSASFWGALETPQ